MKKLDLIVIENATQWLEEQNAVWLCTVLHTYGSAPRSPGALLAATADGKYVGSLSGGCIEENFLEKIRQQQFTLKSQTIRYGSGEADTPPNVKLPCGGSIDVLIEYLEPNKQSVLYLQKMYAALQGKISLQKTIELGKAANLAEIDQAVPLRVTESNGTICINLQSCTTIFIACISAVAMYCIEFAHALGFSVIVCEYREEELRQITQSPLLDKVQLIQKFPATYLEDHGCTAQIAILALTHDPRIDDLTLMEACTTPAFYIGAMGSNKNSENRRVRLKDAGGLGDADLVRIHAPIGLSIGSKTPAEIALAIMADIVKVKNRV